MAGLPTHVALLAPVPLEHLISGMETCANEGKVAFGSRAFEVLAKLRDIVDNAPCDVLIYASDAKSSGPPLVTWQGRYKGFVEAKVGRHPAGMKYRPASTADNMDDNHGHWYIFWEVSDLKRLQPDEQRLIADLKGSEKKAKFAAGFIPLGPIVIEAP